MKLIYSIKLALVTGVILISAAAQAQQTTQSSSTATTPSTQTDTSWKPVRRIWGYAFGDYYYAAHADAGGRGADLNYAGVPTYRNAFQFRRIYLGYDYDISKTFTAQILLASEPTASTSVSGTTAIQNNDNLVDGKMSFFIKNIDLRWKNIWTGTDLVLGEQPTPTWSLLTENLWGYRFVERTVADMRKQGNSYDVGVALQGAFDPSSRNFGYNVMVGNNSQASLLSAANANTGFYKYFYGDVYGYFLDKRLVLDLYADYVRTAPATAAIGGQSRNMLKAAVAYTTPVVTVGFEGFTNNIVNGVTATEGTTKTVVNAKVEAFSVYVRGPIVKDKLGYFVRYDSYNPDNDFNSEDTYAVNTNLSSYNPYQKEHFYLAGLDFTPAKNVHFTPNVWLTDFVDQRPSTATGYIPNDHTLVYRLTFFFTFGK